jgi:basic amino acid/polyamine antiporter, APA family
LKTLKRGITGWEFAALIINITMGAGILGLPAKAYELLGVYSILAFVVCGLFIGLVILCFAEVGSRFRKTGGPYLYALESFGSAVGFQAGWLLWLSRLFAFASVCNLLVNYTSFFFPGLAGGWERSGFITIVILILALLNWIGIRYTTIVNDILAVIKVVLLLGFVIAGSFHMDRKAFHIPSLPPLADFSTAILLLVFAFSGFDVAAVASGEVRNPRKNIPFALGIALGIVTLLYIGIQVVSIGSLPGLAKSERPLSDATSLFAGKAGVAFFTIGAIVTITGTLNVLILTCSRLLFAMAEQRQVPSFLREVHPRFKTPTYALLTSTAILLVLTIYSNFIGALSISAVIRLFTFGTTAISLFRFRKKLGPAAFTIRHAAPVVLIVILVSFGLLWYSDWAEVRAAAILAMVGFFVSLTRYL